MYLVAFYSNIYNLENKVHHGSIYNQNKEHM